MLWPNCPSPDHHLIFTTANSNNNSRGTGGQVHGVSLCGQNITACGEYNYVSPHLELYRADSETKGLQAGFTKVGADHYHSQV